jgi:hypothetical protein
VDGDHEVSTIRVSEWIKELPLIVERWISGNFQFPVYPICLRRWYRPHAADYYIVTDASVAAEKIGEA